MKTRSIVFYIILGLFLVAMVAGVSYWVIGLPPSQSGKPTRFDALQFLTQVILSLATTVALVSSIYGKRFINWLHGPVLRFVTQMDDDHCVLKVGRSGDDNSDVLRVYLHVENDGRTPATGCQLIANKVYVSVDGLRYVQYQSWQTAKFQWVYASKDNKYDAEIRKSLERFARIVEIVQQDQSGDSDDEASEEIIVDRHLRNEVEASWFVVQLPMAEYFDKGIKIPLQYKHIILPITCVSVEADAFVGYFHLGWRGSSVSLYRQPGMLEVDFMTERRFIALTK